MKKALSWRQDYYYDRDAAYNAVQFFESEIYHIKGPLAGRTLHLEPWERRLVRRVYGWKNKEDHTRKHKVVFVFIPRKNGKALAIDTPIITPGGLRTMADLKVGDYVFSPEGRPIRISGITETMLDRECFEIQFADGGKIVCDGDHEWVDTNGKVHTARKLELKNSKIFIQDNDCLQFPKRETPIDPYFLGVLFASKDKSHKITCRDLRVFEKIEMNGVKLKHIKCPVPRYRYKAMPKCPLGWNREGGSYELELSKNDLLNRNKIPSIYLYNDFETRMELLRGYMDVRGRNLSNRINKYQVSHSSKGLIDDFAILVKSLGAGRVNITKDVKEKYTLYTLNFYLKVTDLLRKGLKKDINVYKSPKKIVKVRQIASVPVKCIEVDSADKLYLCGTGLYTTHNSLLGAGFGLLGLFADGQTHTVPDPEDPTSGKMVKMFFPELGAEVYSAAVDKNQAKVVFDVASQMISYNERLQVIPGFDGDRFTEKTKQEIRYLERRGDQEIELAKYIALSADVPSKHGMNPSTIVFDELHTQPNGNLVEVLKTGVLARSQPLQIYFTTAGHDKESVCYEYYDRAKKVLSGEINDPSFYPVIYEASPDDDWHDPEVWKKANPNLGIAIPMASFREAYQEGLINGREENSFKRLHLNIWTSTLDRWLDMYQWKLCGDKKFDPEILRGCPCIAGVDLSRKFDITALILLFSGRDIPGCKDDDVYVLPRFWLPSEQIPKRDKGKGDSVSYTKWATAGFIETTPGPIVDFKRIENCIVGMGNDYKIKEICYDPYIATDLATNLKNRKFTVVEISQTISKLSAPSKELEALLASTTLRHSDHPVLNWMAKNVACYEDTKGNIMPDKGKSTERIDGISALVNALARLLVLRNKQSRYSKAGLL